MEMVFVPSGQFIMGSTQEEVNYAVQICNEFFYNCLPEWFNDEMPAHPVSLSSFWIDRTEVTNSQFTACVSAGPCAPPADGGSVTRSTYSGDPAYAAYPVLDVGADDAAAYCSWFHPSEQYGEWDVTPGFRCASSSAPGA